MKLLLDIGNTRLKWAQWHDGRFLAHGALAHDGAPVAAIAALPADAPESIWVGQVVGRDHEAALSDALRQRYALTPQYARSGDHWHELRNAYREPQRLGVDRWLAMIAAWHEHRGAACVVDAGTALTVDVIDAQGQHQGGLIAAGLQTQQRAVLGATRFATRPGDEHDALHGALGIDTESCVRQGAVLACVGAVQQASAPLPEAALRLLTGGDGERLLPLLGARWQWRPLLVLEGLAALSLG